MKLKNKKYTTIWYDKNVVYIIDQTELPLRFRIEKLKNLKDFCDAISKMKVRGAPLIGVTAAFGFAQSICNNPKKANIQKVYSKLLKTRPTAVNLKWALEKIKQQIDKFPDKEKGKKALVLAKEIREKDINDCKKIGENGFEIINRIYKKTKKPVNILTHCNAGWLATVDHGTALSPIFLAKKKKIPVHVWVDETRPRNQGGLLTVWELKNEKIPYTLVVDNAGGYLMQNNKIDMCLVGSDRTTVNGDVCNKIGTYLKALSAFENNIPFYVALPTSTIDKKLKEISNIPIEERDKSEISQMNFKYKNKVLNGRIYPGEVKCYNPAFDVTPSKFVSKLITEKGVINANNKEILKILK